MKFFGKAVVLLVEGVKMLNKKKRESKDTILGYVNQNGYVPTPLVFVVKDIENKVYLVYPTFFKHYIDDTEEEVLVQPGLIKIIEEQLYPKGVCAWMTRNGDVKHYHPMFVDLLIKLNKVWKSFKKVNERLRLF